ncbi:methionine ABC transporter ATP-binding protein [Actinokineospora sp. UTMC 2448]|uniref:methionine ABC transporter ATP-binding protein n=1 Tax=Actinokineospora sp. UTMC 2448 TaxID=2268449 RepID=UPI002164C1CE|nr:ATP-binding cassette domain-containing protein [Actinokineospora sp. UTMC 2448]UVS79216.1 Methionine import ATP-binding protein MetN [Actinokineospora sp. UTMC 2448]
MTDGIVLTGLRKVYPLRGGDVVALDGIDLRVPRGAIHGIVGESGAGKSTLVRCVTALERPTSGSVLVDGEAVGAAGERDLRRVRRRIGMVFQQVNLFDSRTAAENIAYPLRIAKVPAARRRERVAELLDLVGLAGRGGSYPAQLSGGQKQRVGIARALAADPSVLLCDEPTSALDAATTRQILALIRDVRDRVGVTVLIITHEMSVVREVCDSVSLLDRGRIVEHGPIGEVVGRHGTRLARELIPLPVTADSTAVEAAFAVEHTGEVFRAIGGIDGVAVAAGTVETLGGVRVGRLRLDVAPDRRAAALAALREAGLHVTVASGEEAA